MMIGMLMLAAALDTTAAIRVNQLGYLPDAPKAAADSGTVLTSSGSQPVPGRQCSGEWTLTPGRWRA